MTTATAAPQTDPAKEAFRQRYGAARTAALSKLFEAHAILARCHAEAQSIDEYCHLVVDSNLDSMRDILSAMSRLHLSLRVMNYSSPSRRAAASPSTDPNARDRSGDGEQPA